MKVGDLVLIKATTVPGIRRPIPPGSRGVVVEVPPEYEGDLVVVRSAAIRGDEWLPVGAGWTFYAEQLLVVGVEKPKAGRVVRLHDGTTVAVIRRHEGSDCWACVVVAPEAKAGARTCVAAVDLVAGEPVAL